MRLKKVFAGALAAAMLVCAVAVPAFAAEEVEQENGQSSSYVQMNIPYADFYKAAGVDNASEIDAVTSATKNKTRAGNLAAGSYHVNADGTDITGVSCPVKVLTPWALKNAKQVTDADSYDITVKLRGKESTTTYTGVDALFENESYASSTAQTMRHLRVAVMEMCQDAKLYQIDLLSSKKRVSEREYWMKRRSQMKLDRENAALLAAGQQPTQTEFETAKETLRKQISDVLDNAASFEDFSDRLLQQYGITVKKSRGRLSYLPAGRKKFIRAHSLGDKFEKELVLATLKENAKSQPIILHSNLEEKPDRIKKLVDIQAKLKQGKGIGYERWAKKHNLKAMAQTLILLQEKGLLNEDALDQRIAELDTKFHESLAVVKDLETRMANNQTLRRYAASYKQYRPLAQKRNAAKSPATFEEQHRAELTAYRTAAAYLKANNITKLPSPNKLEAEYCALASEKAQFYEQYKEAKIELLKLKDAKQNVALFFREDERTQHHER